MLAPLATIRTRVALFRMSRTILASLKNLEREMQETVLQNNPALANNGLIVLFRAEVQQSRFHARNGRIDRALEYHKYARETRHFVARNAQLSRKRQRQPRFVPD